MADLLILMQQKYFFALSVRSMDHSRLASLSTIVKWKKFGTWHDVHFCHKCQSCSWHHTHRMPGTKWQCSWPCFGDWNVVFNKPDHKLIERLLSFFLNSVPLTWIVPHVSLATQSVKGLNWTELIERAHWCFFRWSPPLIWLWIPLFCFNSWKDHGGWEEASQEVITNRGLHPQYQGLPSIVSQRTKERRPRANSSRQHKNTATTAAKIVCQIMF